MIEWANLFAYTTAVFGLAFIAGHAKISLAPREWLATKGKAGMWLVTLLECPPCVSFWLGLLAIAFPPLDALPAVVWPPFFCGSSFILGRFTGLIREV